MGQSTLSLGCKTGTKIYNNYRSSLSAIPDNLFSTELMMWLRMTAWELEYGSLPETHPPVTTMIHLCLGLMPTINHESL